MSENKPELAIVSGGFDPLHIGHVKLIRAASVGGTRPVVAIVNSDDWLRRKKGEPCVLYHQRAMIVLALDFVDAVFVGGDDEEGSVADALRQIATERPEFQLVFCNGGDRGSPDDLPEAEKKVCAELGIRTEFGVGGKYKSDSSSRYHVERRVDRLWGHYVDYYRTPTLVMKRLYFRKGQATSMQRHMLRNEFWLVEDGVARILKGPDESTEEWVSQVLEPGLVGFCTQGTWHQIRCTGAEPLVIVELQFGPRCLEDDIERRVEE